MNDFEARTHSVLYESRFSGLTLNVKWKKLQTQVSTRMLQKDSRMNLRYISVVLIFVMCQIVGVMCAMPDVSLADEGVFLSEDMTGCPMDGNFMCPPSLTSSSDRAAKNGWASTAEQSLHAADSALLWDGRITRVLTGSDSSPPIVSLLSVSFTVLRI